MPMASAPQEVFGAATLGHQQVKPRQNTLPMANDAGIHQAEKKQKNRSEPTLSRCRTRKDHIPSPEHFVDSTPCSRGGLPMESVSVERLDHLGVVAAVIKDL